jgi:hypothetical protein
MGATTRGGSAKPRPRPSSRLLQVRTLIEEPPLAAKRLGGFSPSSACSRASRQDETRLIRSARPHPSGNLQAVRRSKTRGEVVVEVGVAQLSGLTPVVRQVLARKARGLLHPIALGIRSRSAPSHGTGIWHLGPGIREDARCGVSTRISCSAGDVPIPMASAPRNPGVTYPPRRSRRAPTTGRAREPRAHA